MSKTDIYASRLKLLFRAYSSNELTSVERNTAAYANEVYNVTDSSGRQYVLRVLKAQLPETVQIEALMQDRLAAAGIGTPKYLVLRNGTPVGEHEGILFTLSKYIDGQVPKTASLGLVQDFGATLAKLHDCLDGMTLPPSNMQWFNLRNAERNLQAYHGQLKDPLTQLVGSGEKLLGQGLPKTLIHADLWLGNVFAADDKITTVFDLDTAENTTRIIDLARTYLSMRLNTKHAPEALTQLLFAGYDQAAAKPLMDAEKVNFGIAASYVAGVCATWHAQHGTRYAGRYIEFGQEALDKESQ